MRQFELVNRVHVGGELMEDNSLFRTDKELAEMYQRNINRVYLL